MGRLTERSETPHGAEYIADCRICGTHCTIALVISAAVARVFFKELIMWTVGSEMRDRVAYCFVFNLETGERKHGEFDCERSAQIFANYLNKRDAR